MKQLKPVSGENLEDLHLAELECQRVHVHQTLLNSVHGANLEDLSHRHDRHEELECQRSAPHARATSHQERL